MLIVSFYFLHILLFQEALKMYIDHFMFQEMQACGVVCKQVFKKQVLD